MEKILVVAKTMNDLHKEKYGKRMDQMRMHKLLYFAQKQALVEGEEPLFPETFQGWRFGPVSTIVRAQYDKDEPYASVTGSLNEAEKELVGKVFRRYENVSSWELANLSHEEFSWQLSRTGLSPEENGNEEIPIDAIRLDAISEKMSQEEA